MFLLYAEYNEYMTMMSIKHETATIRPTTTITILYY